tara:strand:+ start:275 stop:541 length:267 start_codon:yes stop_codon:yes gene_type:complete
MESIRRNLLKANKCDSLSKEQYSYESWVLGNIKGMVSFWADENNLRGEPMTGHQLVAWKKEVFKRIQELDKIFKECDEDLAKRRGWDK